MKNLFSKLMFVALTATAFTACEDVPTPYDVPGTGTNVPGAIEIPGGEGAGSFAEPFNAIAAINFGNTLSIGETSKDYMYIKGVVSKLANAETDRFEKNSYGNGTFYISNDGGHGNEFYVYRVNYLGNKRFASGDTPVAVGDNVIICAKITNYNGTIETNQGEGFIYELNGVNRGGEILPSEEDDEPAEPAGDGTLENPFNAAAANLEAAKLADRETSANPYYIKGKVANIRYNYGEGNYPASADYYISDNGKNSNTFYIYGSKYLGNTNYSSGVTLSVGDEVIVYGQLYNYQGTYETATNKSFLYSLNGQTEGGTPEPLPETNVTKTVSGSILTLTTNGVTASTTTVTVDFTAMGWEHQASEPSGTTADGVQIVTAKGEGTAPKYWKSGNFDEIRLYAKNSITITGTKPIAKVVATCTSETYVGGAALYASAEGNSITIVNEGESGGTQLRMKSMVITYAE